MLVVEQNWKKRILNALTDGKYNADNLTKSVVKSLKSFYVIDESLCCEMIGEQNRFS